MKKIGLWSSTALVTGNMIGSGIFLLPATLASFGGIGLMGWLYSAMGALLFTLVFRQLSQRLPETIGGPYAYVKLMLGDFWGFLVGWGYWVSIWCTNAAIAVAFVGYLSVFLPEINSNTPLAIGCGLGAIWALSAVNSFSRYQRFLRFIIIIMNVELTKIVADVDHVLCDQQEINYFM